MEVAVRPEMVTVLITAASMVASVTVMHAPEYVIAAVARAVPVTTPVAGPYTLVILVRQTM